MDTTLDAPDEQFYTVRELARRWKLARHAVYGIVADAPGVIRIYTGTGQRARFRVPVSVAERIERTLFRVVGQ
jgi:hypothetical protein